MLQGLTQQLAALLVANKIINFNFKQPITFKSGIKSPIYCDFRKCAGYPHLMELIESCFTELMSTEDFEVIAGVATGGVPHASYLAKALTKPLAYIRPGAKVKDYGLSKLIEGADVAGKEVALIEDLVSTAGSLIENTKILLAAGAKSVTGYSIFSYDMKRSTEELATAQLNLQSILNIHDLIPFLRDSLTDDELSLLMEWIKNPEEWFDIHKLNFDFGYLTKLRHASKTTGNIICFGVDPVIEAMPGEFALQGIYGVVPYFDTLFTEFKRKGLAPAAFKINQGFFLCHDNARQGDFSGSEALATMLDLIEDKFPESNIILDFKRGDIGKSSANYAIEGFNSWEAQALTISGYMGDDSVEPFIKYCNPNDEKGVYILTRTSNPGAKNLQSKKVADGRFVYEVMGDDVLRWVKGRPGVGAVIGATSIPELKSLMEKFSGKDIPLLIPGVGGQGGKGSDVKALIEETNFERELVRVNSSSGLSHPWGKEPAPTNWLEECVKAFESLLAETA